VLVREKQSLPCLDEATMQMADSSGGHSSHASTSRCSPTLLVPLPFSVGLGRPSVGHIPRCFPLPPPRIGGQFLPAAATAVVATEEPRKHRHTGVRRSSPQAAAGRRHQRQWRAQSDTHLLRVCLVAYSNGKSHFRGIKCQDGNSGATQTREEKRPSSRCSAGMRKTGCGGSGGSACSQSAPETTSS
jgi:hypothetical protein